MTDPDNLLLRFRCPRCCLLLEAAPNEIGTELACPACYEPVVVPPESRGDQPLDEYRVREFGEVTPEAQPAFVVVRCPLCDTHMEADQQQVGQQLTCPDCDTPVTVPSPEPSKSPKAGSSARPSAVEEYALSDKLHGWDSSAAASDDGYFPVYCPLCDTMMQVGTEQIGESIVCPDCGVSSTVMTPPESKKASPGPVDPTDVEYALHQGVAQPGPGSAARRPYVPVECPICGARLHAEVDQIGEEIVCPDCDRPVVVPAPPKLPPKPDVMAGAGEAVPMGQATGVPDRQPILSRPRWHAGYAVGPAEDRDGTELVHVLPEPPRWPFLSGILGFLVYRGVHTRWIGLSMTAVAVVWICFGGHFLGAMPDRGIVSVGVQMTSLVLLGTTTLLLAIWGTVASAFCLAILRDSAAGNDRIENWPEAIFLDWALDGLYLLGSLVVAVVAGMFLQWLLEPVGLPEEMGVFGGVAAVFPIALLSMLERGSPLGLISPAVWDSLWRRRGAWATFYIASVILAAATMGLTAVIVLLPGLVAMPLVVTLFVGALLLYFRLLGRLAWCCSSGPERRRPRPAVAVEEKTDEPAPS